MDAEALTSERLTLRLPVKPTSVGLGRRAAVQFAEEVSCAPETLWCVRAAVSEAITNVVLHAHPEPPGPGEGLPHFELLAEADEHGCTISILDDGIGLRSRPDSPGMGLGLGLIARSCEKLALDAAPGGGTAVRMVFRRS